MWNMSSRFSIGGISLREKECVAFSGLSLVISKCFFILMPIFFGRLLYTTDRNPAAASASQARLLMYPVPSATRAIKCEVNGRISK